MRKTKDLITGAVLMGLAVFYIVSSLSIKVFEGQGKTVINAGTIPRMWGICLLLLSVLLTVRGIRGVRGGQKKAAGGGLKTWMVRNHAVLGTFLILTLYVILLGRVGYVIDTVGYLFFQMLLLSPVGEKKAVPAFILALISSVVTYYLFVHLLNVPLPAGILPL